MLLVVGELLPQVPARHAPHQRPTLQFRSSVPGWFDTTQNAGYLFDNVTTTTSNGPGPQGCDVLIDKQADSPTVTAGGIEGYRLTVRNRGRLSERNLLLCDHIPNHTTFVSADRKLRRLGRRRCLLIPRLSPAIAPASTSCSASTRTRRRATWTTSPTSRPYHRQACPRCPTGAEGGTCRRVPPRRDREAPADREG